jgi:hypothetical protein
MGKEFLENLKKAVEEGEFNSEAAKKINEVDKLADEKKDAAKLVDERLAAAGIKNISEEDGIILSSDYEKKMELIKQQDTINKQLATLIEIEDMTKITISDMISFAQELEDKFAKEFEAEDPMYAELSQKIEQIQLTYKSFI